MFSFIFIMRYKYINIHTHSLCHEQKMIGWLGSDGTSPSSRYRCLQKMMRNILLFFSFVDCWSAILKPVVCCVANRVAWKLLLLQASNCVISSLKPIVMCRLCSMCKLSINKIFTFSWACIKGVYNRRTIICCALFLWLLIIK